MGRPLSLAALVLCLGLAAAGCRPNANAKTAPPGLDRERFLFENVLFEFDHHDIRPDQVQAIYFKVDYLQQNPSARAVIQGHCDERGTEAYNEALGDRRAKAVYNYLVDHGVDGSRLSTVSYGKDFPLDPGHDEGAWQRNRRAQFVLQ
ncbi:MAG: OmpA family protein [Deltaproteobacteria bacterium]|jgi:peptidoglycan-associated lipoprotein|nr:OmpA family protein [Deltaproteobacteria bacterium]